MKFVLTKKRPPEVCTLEGLSVPEIGIEPILTLQSTGF